MAKRPTRTIALELKDFARLPPALIDSATNEAVEQLTIDVKALLHHYFLAKYGDGQEDQGVYEYEGHLTDGTDWRFRGSGIGNDREAKRNVSNELGKAFARWFHHEHLGFTYFCPLENLIGRRNDDGSRWERNGDGDLPDYVCGRRQRDVNLLETKGRYSPISFKTKEFESFREQLQRARLTDARGRALAVKGFVSAARWATEDHPRINAKLLVEDPTTEGEPPGQAGYPPQFGAAMVAGHYTSVLGQLQLPAHAESLRDAATISAQTGVRRGIWRCITGALAGRRFVGGILPQGLVHAWGGPPWMFPDEFELRQWWRWIRLYDSPFVLSTDSVLRSRRGSDEGECV